MNIKSKLNFIITQIIPSGDFSNKEKLLLEYQALIKRVYFSSIKPDEAFMKALINNQFYQQFKLHVGLAILKAIIKKIDDIVLLNSLLTTSEISITSYEKKIIEQQLKFLEFYSTLKENLKREERPIPEEHKKTIDESQISFDKIPEEDENKRDQTIPEIIEDNFFEVYFEDLEEWKRIYSSEKIKPKNIEWFLDSDLFEYVSGAFECFDIELEDFYQLLLETAEINRKDFPIHKEILQKKMEKAYKENEEFNYTNFPKILKNVEKASLSSPYNTFFKLPKAAGLSPTARNALTNNLIHYMHPKKQNRFKPY